MAANVGGRLKAVRNANGLSQRELAKRAGVTNGLISMIEQNRSSPSVASLKRILDAVPMTFSDFFSLEYAGREKLFYKAGELQEINPARVYRIDADVAKLVSCVRWATPQSIIYRCFTRSMNRAPTRGWSFSRMRQRNPGSSSQAKSN